jgi:hypothetical protein
VGFRKLRIAWSACWGLASVLVVLLWVRSYWWMDQVYGHTAKTKVLHFGSMQGQVTFRYINKYTGTGIRKNWIPQKESIAAINKRRETWANPNEELLVYRYGSRFNFGWLRRGFFVPHWTLALIAGLLSAASWLPLRFSLRTLLIGVTLVAVVLALITWIAR